LHVLAANPAGVGEAFSALTAPIEAGEAPDSSSIVAPLISGGAREDQYLRASSGLWHGSSKTTFSFIWLRCDDKGNGCQPAPRPVDKGKVKALPSEYRLGPKDVGHTIKAEIKATGQGPDVAVQSEASPVVSFNTKRCTITGKGQIQGTDGADVLCGSPGPDTIYVGDGDTAFANDGEDLVYGSSGVNVIYGGRGRDHIYGGMGNDLLVSGPDHDSIYGGGGDDMLFGVGGKDHLEGNWGHDVMLGGAGNDFLYGGTGGDDMLATDGERDVVLGGEGKNTSKFDPKKDKVLMNGDPSDIKPPKPTEPEGGDDGGGDTGGDDDEGGDTGGDDDEGGDTGGDEVSRSYADPRGDAEVGAPDITTLVALEEGDIVGVGVHFDNRPQGMRGGAANEFFVVDFYSPNSTGCERRKIASIIYNGENTGLFRCLNGEMELINVSQRGSHEGTNYIVALTRSELGLRGRFSFTVTAISHVGGELRGDLAPNNAAYVFP
jgi:hypothetical protein